MVYNIDGMDINFPEEAERDYKETMKLPLDLDCVSVYVEVAKMQNPSLSDSSEISRAAIEEMYHEISSYTTFPGRHCA